MATTFGAPVLMRMTVWADEVVPENGQERPSTTVSGPAAP
jgi:hypothetical protein